MNGFSGLVGYYSENSKILEILIQTKSTTDDEDKRIELWHWLGLFVSPRYLLYSKRYFIMNKKMTWNDMKIKFPDEWLLITDFDLDKSGHLIAGIVERHSRKKDEVYQLPALNKPTAFRYTGESTFSGLRDHARKHNLL